MYTIEYILNKINTIEEQLDTGIQSTELNTNQSVHKVVYSTTGLERSLWRWKNKLKQLYPSEYKKMYGSTYFYGISNRR